MVEYVVVSESVELGIGTILALNADQVDRRRHQLKDAKGGKYEAIHRVTFKRGEVLGIEGELDKGSLQRLRATADGDPDAPAGDKPKKARARKPRDKARG
jgi:hypothetical protein